MGWKGVLVGLIGIVVLVMVVFRWSDQEWPSNDVVQAEVEDDSELGGVASEEGSEEVGRGGMKDILHPPPLVPAGMSSGRAQRPSRSLHRRSIPLELVDDVNRDPVPGARVYFIKGIQRRNAEWGLEGGFELQADEQGLVELPAFSSTATVYARKDHLWGHSVLGVNDQTRVVVLRPDWSPVIQTVGPGRTPIGDIPLKIRDWRGVTSSLDGTVRVPHVQELLSRRGQVRVTPSMASVLDRSVVLDIHDREDVVVLEVPLSGALRIHCLDSEGEPVEGELEFYVRSTHHSALSSSFRGVSPFLLEHVEVDGEFNLTIRHTSTRHAEFKQKIRGPRAPYSTESLTLTLPDPSQVLRARVVDESGRPIRQSRFLALCSRGHSFRYDLKTGREIATDEEGWVDFPLLKPLRNNQDSHFVLTSPRESRPSRRGVLLIPREQKMGVIDLGDLVLEPLPILVRGRVEERGGKPIARARVSVSEKGLVQRPEAVTAADGTFTIYHEMDEGFPLAFEATGYGTREIREVQPGTEDLLVVLGPSAVVRGRVVADESSAFDSLVVQMGARREDVSRSGSFQLDVEGYEGDLEVLVKGISKPLVTIEGLRFGPGAICKDERLDPIDLRGTLLGGILTVLDEEGHPVSGALVATDKPEDFQFTDSRGRAHVVLDARYPELHISSGRRFCATSRTWSVGQDRMEVVLQARPELAVSLSSNSASPGYDCVFRLDVFALFEGKGLELPKNVHLPSTGEVTLSFPSTGDYRLECRLANGRASNTWSDRFVVVEALSIEGANDPLVLDISEEKVEAARKTMK